MISRTKAMFLVLSLLIVGIVFSGCSSPQTTSNTGNTTPETTVEKKGDTTITGKVVTKGGKYYVEQSGKPLQDLDSYSIDLSSYTDKNVTITGQFSGDTLFVGKIQ